MLKRIIFLLLISACLLARADFVGTDTLFGTKGVATSVLGSQAQVRGLAQLGDGKIIVVGDATINGVQQIFIARYTTTGVLDVSFGTNGVTTTSIGSSSAGNMVALQASDASIVGGYSLQSSQLSGILTRYSAGGNQDSSFGSSGVARALVGSSTVIKSIYIQPDQKIIVGGNAVIDGISQFVVLRYTQDGILDTSFATIGYIVNNIGNVDSLNTIKLQSDGSVIAAGSTIMSGIRKIVAIKFTNSGLLDTTFADTGVFTYQVDDSIDDQILNCVIQSDDKIILAGRSQISGIGVITLMRLTSVGVLDSSFGTNGIVTTSISGAEVNAKAVALQADGKIVIAGKSGDHVFIARYTDTGLLDSTFGSGGMLQDSWGAIDNLNTVLVQTDDKILVAGAQDSLIAVARYNPNNSDTITIASPADTATVTTNTLTYSGVSSQSGRTIELKLDGNTIGTTTTDSDGVWNLSSSIILTNGSHTIAADLKNGSTVLATASNSFTVNASDAISISSPSSGDTLITLTPTFAGQVSESSGSVRLSVDSVIMDTVSANASGAWQTTSTRLTNGNHSLLAELMVNGNPVASDTKNFAVNIYPPFAAFNAPALGSTIVTNTTPINGFCSDASVSLQVHVDGKLFAITQADASGNWDAGTSDTLANGLHSILVVVTDATGAVLIASSTYFTVNT